MQNIPASLRAKASAKRMTIVVRPKSRSALLLGIALLLAFVMNTISACAPLTQTVLDSIVLGTYPATEEDVRAAEAAYAAKEKALKEEIDHYQQRHPGYNEYRITTADIWHDPYALMAIISAWYDGKEWTINEATPVIEKYFALQYILTEDVETITKYRTEQRTGQRLGRRRATCRRRRLRRRRGHRAGLRLDGRPRPRRAGGEEQRGERRNQAYGTGGTKNGKHGWGTLAAGNH